MTPKEKAKKLVDNMLNEQSYTEDLYDAKQCALIAVDELIEAHIKISKEESGTTLIDYGQNYWQEVKQEIENL
jgi:hypothetical protein